MGPRQFLRTISSLRSFSGYLRFLRTMVIPLPLLRHTVKVHPKTNGGDSCEAIVFGTCYESLAAQVNWLTLGGYRRKIYVHSHQATLRNQTRSENEHSGNADVTSVTFTRSHSTFAALPGKAHRSTQPIAPMLPKFHGFFAVTFSQNYRGACSVNKTNKMPAWCMGGAKNSLSEED